MITGLSPVNALMRAASAAASTGAGLLAAASTCRTSDAGWPLRQNITQSANPLSLCGQGAELVVDDVADQGIGAITAGLGNKDFLTFGPVFLLALAQKGDAGGALGLQLGRSSARPAPAV